MDLLWMILPVILVCAEAPNVTEVKVELGQNVTLTCSVDNSNTYWYMEMYDSQIRAHISRSFSNDPADSQYYVYTFRRKYSAFGNTLMISNITAEDCRLYFCGRKINTNIQFVDTFSLLSDVPVTAPTNTSEGNEPSIQQKELIIYSSFALNVLLLLIISLVCSLDCLKRKKKKKNCTCQMTEPPPLYDSPETMDPQPYEEIQLPPYRPPPPAGLSECIYYKAQLPRSTHRGH